MLPVIGFHAGSLVYAPCKYDHASSVQNYNKRNAPWFLRTRPVTSPEKVVDRFRRCGRGLTLARVRTSPLCANRALYKEYPKDIATMPDVKATHSRLRMSSLFPRVRRWVRHVSGRRPTGNDPGPSLHRWVQQSRASSIVLGFFHVAFVWHVGF